MTAAAGLVALLHNGKKTQDIKETKQTHQKSRGLSSNVQTVPTVLVNGFDKV